MTTSPTTARFAIYPMVEESQATGAVAGVYAALLVEMPMVPSLFKSLALCPGYLVLAAEQALPALGDVTFRELADGLVSSVTDASTPPADAEVCSALAEFVDPLSQMSLLAAGLRLALDGDLHASPAPGHFPPDRPVRPQRPAPSTHEAPAVELYSQIRSALRTPIVNSVWRSLAADGLLRSAWAVLGPQSGGVEEAADALCGRSFAAAREVPWQVAANPAALEAAGVSDAAPGMAAVLDAYSVTLSKVLALIASSAEAAN